MPAAMASTASTVVTVGEILMLSSGKSPERISQMPSRSIPRFLLARLLVSAKLVPPVNYHSKLDLSATISYKEQLEDG